MAYACRLEWVKKQFQQQCSKIGYTREQLFHAWRPIHLDENRKKTFDSCVTCIRQVATLLVYGKPQVLEVFKNTLPVRLYWVFFLIEDLNLAVQTAKRITTKEKIYRKLAGQSSLMPLMSIKDGNNNNKVTFDTQDTLDDKGDKITSMMSKLTAQDNNPNKQYKPKIYQCKQRGQSRNFYDWNKYDLWNY